MAKGCALSTGYLPQGGLPRNSVDRLTDHPDMTSAVDRGRKASTQTNKQISFLIGYSLFLQVTRSFITSRMSSKFGQIGLRTAELAAHELLEKSP